LWIEVFGFVKLGAPQGGSGYRGACDRAVLFVFENAEPDYVPSNEARAFFKRYVGNRPLTYALLRSAHDAFKEHQRSQDREGLLGFSERPQTKAAAPTYDGIDELSDAELENLYRGTRRVHAQTSRGVGVLA
jgi:hypothetical protein